MFKTEREKYIWLAALIDGEGSVMISVEDTKKDTRKYSLSIRPMIRIGMTDKKIITFVSLNFGGTLTEGKKWDKNKIKQYKNVYTWTLRGFKQTMDVFHKIEPFLIVKKEKVQIINNFINFYKKLIKQPLIDPRLKRGWTERKRLANRDTQLLLKFLIDNWFSKFYSLNHISYQHTIKLLSLENKS